MAHAPDPVWLRSYPSGIPASIEDELDRWPSVMALVSANASKHSANIAFSSIGGSLTFGDVMRRAREFAGYLQSIGVGPGDRVAMMMPNCLQYPVAIFGTLLAGAVVVNVNPLYTPRELAHQLTDSGAAVIVVIDLVAPTLAACLAGAAVRHVVMTGLGDLAGVAGPLISAAARRKRRIRPGVIAGAMRFRAALRAGRRHGFSPVSAGPDDLAFLQYTGGTTGVAKGAMLTNRNIVANVLQSSIWLGPEIAREPMVNLTLLPMYHVFSLTASALTFFVLGGESVLVPDPRDVGRLLRMIKGRTFGGLCGTNTLFANLLENEAFRGLDFSAMRLVISGGMAMQRGLAERWFAVTGTPITEGYGLTESSPVLTSNPIDLGHPERMRFTGSVGLPVPSTEIGLRRADGGWAEIGEPGEICARGPQVMKGYWHRQAATDDVLDADGWLSTGDVGIMDENGMVRIVDRLKDIIIVSGFNVYPSEIEEVVAMHPGVREAAAIGIRHETAGERVRLIVVPRDGPLTSGDIIAHCRRHLTGYKIPVVVEFRDMPLPRSNVGKLLRRELPAEATTPTSASPSLGRKTRSLVG